MSDHKPPPYEPLEVAKEYRKTADYWERVGRMASDEGDVISARESFMAAQIWRQKAREIEAKFQ